MEDVISLGVGEPDFITPWRIREAGIYSLERGYTSYTSNYGMLELRRELSRHLAQRYGLEYDPQGELLITVGVSEALDLALRAILNPGDEVLMPDPTYVSYQPCTIMTGAVPVPVPTSMEADFQLLAEEVRARLTAQSKAILLAYPNNPTGAVMRREVLEELARIAEQEDLLVISDEIYDRLVYGVEHVCFAALPGMKERTILLGGFSKAYAMTGWRLGYAAARRDIIEAMVKIHQYTLMCAPTMAQWAALAALREGEGDVLEMLAEYDRRRRVIVQGLNQIGLTCFEPRGAFYAFPSIRATGLSSEEFAERLLLEERVAVVPGNAFGARGEGHVRCCYATSMENIERALERIERFVEGL
jgi:aminotransferase